MDDFSKEMVRLVQAKLGNEVTVNLEHIIKTNDVKSDGNSEGNTSSIWWCYSYSDRNFDVLQKTYRKIIFHFSELCYII